jgi:hypothetical protein
LPQYVLNDNPVYAAGQCMYPASVCIRPVYVIGIRQIALRAFVIAGPSALGDTVQTGVPKGVKTDE